MSLPLVALISGRGSNLQALLDETAAGHLPVEVRAVVSNRPGVEGLERAHRAGVTAVTVDHRAHVDRPAFEAALTECIEHYRPGLVVLAGFMRILTPEFVARYEGRMLNIHPSLLPAYPGLHTHERVLVAGEPVHGASVHFVTRQVDGGPVIVQARVPVLPDDDPQRLAARVLEQEHRIYPLAVRWFAEGRLRMEAGKAVLDGRVLERPVMIEQDAKLPT
jgi:phosphoribosylglycinamide formyltransferase 1